MRVAALLLLVGVSLVAEGQTPPRPTTPTSPVSGGAGAVTTPTATRPTPTTPALTAVIRGRVVRADNGQPIEGARVGGPGSGFALSGADGRFELTKLRAGTYALTAYANGFPSVGVGSRGPRDPGRPITLTPGQIVNGINFSLFRGAVLAGVVLDERGDPLPHAAVWVLRQRFVNGERRLMREALEPPLDVQSGGDVTDDLGRFRIFGLRAGTYFLAARSWGFSSLRAADASLLDSHDLTAPAMYPTGGSIAEARPLTLAAGQEVSGLSFAVRPVKTAHITIILSSRTGPVAGNVVSYIQSETGVTNSFRTDGDGRQSLGQLSPGTYTFFARSSDQVASARVELNGEDVTVPLTLRRGGVLRGRIVTDVDPGVTSLPAGATVIGRTQSQPSVTVTPNPDGSFEMSGLYGPLTFAVSSTEGGWYLKQVLANGVDVTALRLDTTRDLDDVQIVLTRQSWDLSGIVRDNLGKLAPDAYVVLFAEDPTGRWPGSPYVRVTRVSADGGFVIRGVRPERYRAAAVEFLEDGEASDPDLLAQLDRVSTPVTLGDGVTATLDLRLVPWP